MLRPERMSKVSVTGAKPVIDDVIESVHQQHVLHLSEYGGGWEGFSQGRSLEGAEEVSEKLITVRSLRRTLEVDASTDESPRVIDDDELDVELDRIRQRVNELDDERSDLQRQIRDLDEQIDEVTPFAEVGVDLDLLSGFDSVEVVVGRGSPEAVAAALDEAPAIETYELFTGGSTVAIVAQPADDVDADADADADADPVGDALVSVDFAVLEVPEVDEATSPEDYIEELRRDRQQLRERLETVNRELADLREENGSFLLAAEEQLSIKAEKRQAPLSFATTDNAFVAEGWIPTAEFEPFEAAIGDAVGDHVVVEELQQASFTPDDEAATPPPAGEPADRDTDSTPVTSEPDASEESDETEQPQVVSDGGAPVTMGTDDPPVVQDNPGIATPFETLVKAVNRPNYREFDPTLLVFLTFPLMFGFMIADMGYGVLYLLLGAFLYRQFDSAAFRDIGAISLWAGAFTVLFGAAFGLDVFGYHGYQLLGIEKWPVAKGLSPADGSWAEAWLVITVIFGIVHLNIAWGLDFITGIQEHDLKHALYEAGSWLLILNGLWIWVFSAVTGSSGQFAGLMASGAKPDVLVSGFATLLGIETAGLPEIAGVAGLVLLFSGIVLLGIGEPPELVEVFSPLVNSISYARITAVLLAKGAMALATNILAFGAYITEGGEGEYHFIFSPSTLEHAQTTASEEIVFAGLTPLFEPTGVGVIALVAGLVLAVVGHIVVLLLGITSAGIQAIRLEYVEFLNQFYEGGGRGYEPFGYVRRFTSTE
jgi:Archaeal/vacuolar-type H+-ATPase subunit I